MALNTKTWKPFYLPELFYIDSGNKFDKSKMTTSLYSEINFVGRTASNNGIVAVVDRIEDVKPYQEGYITLALGGSIGSCFIQDAPFYTSQNVAVLIPLDDKMTLKAKQFISTIIRNESVTNYIAFARELNAHIKTDFVIKLPVNKYEKPDYQYMEEYMSSLNSDIASIPDYFLNDGYNKACWYMDNIDVEKFEQKYAGVHTKANVKLSDRKWEKFQIKKIFKTYTGGDLILSNIIQGNIPIVSHSSENNGVDSYTMEIENRPLFDHTKSISLADRGTFFAARQKEDFYIGTRVKAMVFWDEVFNNNTITPFAIDFIVTVINHERFRFSYGRNCTSGLDNLEIKLPVDANGNPDYLFMDAYIKSRPFSVNI